jgi:hypothetical protein
MTEEQYLRRERECIAEYDGKLTREHAEWVADQEAKERASGVIPPDHQRETL